MYRKVKKKKIIFDIIMKNQPRRMTRRIQILTGIAFSILLFIISCTKPENENERIIQSNLVIEDNVNGRIAGNGIIESTNFYYNDDNTLNRATVYDDTVPSAHLLKEINLTYLSDKIIFNSVLDTIGTIEYRIGFNSKKQLISITLPDSSGLYVSYFDDRISNIKTLPSGDEYISFIYDNNDNLLQYELKSGGFVVGRFILEYDNDIVSNEFDSRFLTKDIKFFYLGGLDLISKMGLNYGKSTKNKLIKRTDIIVQTGQVYEHYDFGYIRNNNADIIKRNIRWSTDTLFYQFKY